MKKICAFKTCGNDVWAKGLCGGHYRQQKDGEPIRPLQQQFHGLSESERFTRWVGIQPNGCWNWLGSAKADRLKNEWHGQWRNKAGAIELTHRAAWRLFKGAIPRRALVLHRCDNPRCVNVDHLYLGTQADNVSDMWDRGRARPGTSLGSKHGMSKISENDVLEIRASKLTGRELGEKYGLSTSTIYDIRNRKIWRHVK